MEAPNDDADPDLAESSSPQFRTEVERLYRLTLYGRWLFAGLLWLILGSWSVWDLREPIALMREYFTWSALRYGLVFHPIGALGLGLCVSLTVSVLVWQSRNLIWGLPQAEQKRLHESVCKIRQQGMSHPLWKWVCGQKQS
jgi:hypothetical protein